jgi:hypothetical protein
MGRCRREWIRSSRRGRPSCELVAIYKAGESVDEERSKVFSAISRSVRRRSMRAATTERPLPSLPRGQVGRARGTEK